MKTAFLYLMAVLYILAGLNHFRTPDFYLPMMPPYLPAPELLIFLSGVAEVLLGILLIPRKTRKLAAWGIVALLIAVFLANVYMLQTGGAGFGDISKAALVARLPIQGLLIWWAWTYTRK